MEPIDCPDCKRLFDAARDAAQSHVRAQGHWQIASLRRDDAGKIGELRTVQESAATVRAQAVSAYREHALTHNSE